MDNVKPVEKWQDGGGRLFDTEEDARQSEARRIVRNIIGDVAQQLPSRVDIEKLVDRRTALIDALRKIEKGWEAA